MYLPGSDHIFFYLGLIKVIRREQVTKGSQPYPEAHYTFIKLVQTRYSVLEKWHFLLNTDIWKYELLVVKNVCKQSLPPSLHLFLRKYYRELFLFQECTLCPRIFWGERWKVGHELIKTSDDGYNQLSSAASKCSFISVDE